MYSPRSLPHAGVSESQNFAVVDFDLTASAAGTADVLIPGQSLASAKLWVMTGNGSASMSAAVANALVQRPDMKANDATLAMLSLGLQTYFTAVPAAADGAYCHAFALGGVNPSSILKAELVIMPQSAAGSNATTILSNRASPTLVHQVSLNNSNQFLQDDGTTAVVAGTNTLVVVGGQQSNTFGGSSSNDGADSIVFGAIASPDVTDTPASGAFLVLRLTLKC